MKLHESVQVARGAVAFGDVTVGEDSSIWYNAVVRGDSGPIIVGKHSNIQDNCTLHLDEGGKVQIGDYVTIGHGAIVHGCKIGNRCLIGMGAIILNGAEIGDNCIIGAGTLITQKKVIPAGSMVMGSPGKVIREVTEEEKESVLRNAEHYVKASKEFCK